VAQRGTRWSSQHAFAARRAKLRALCNLAERTLHMRLTTSETNTESLTRAAAIVPIVSLDRCMASLLHAHEIKADGVIRSTSTSSSPRNESFGGVHDRALRRPASLI
jgi:hypothetical protein